MKNLVTEHPFFRFYFEESSPLRSIDISSPDFDFALAFLRSIIPGNYKFVSYRYFQNIY